MSQERVLVVDGYPDTVESICALMGAVGIDARGAPNGADALETALSFDPTIVFLDITLPKMDGFETVRRMSKLRTSRPYFVALTGAHQHRGAAREHGFDDFLLKPAGAAQLLAALERARSIARERDRSM